MGEVEEFKEKVWSVLGEGRRRHGRTSAERFLDRIEFSEGCWEWSGSRRGGGYGGAHAWGKPWSAHRLAYAIENGGLTPGLVVDHLVCSNPPCVRPSHLQECTHRENVTRPGSMSLSRVHKDKTLCPRGHPLEGRNLRPYRPCTQDSYRTCWACWKAVISKHNHRRRYGTEWDEDRLTMEADARYAAIMEDAGCAD